MKYPFFDEALSLLKRGEVIAAKTDTVYGLLADATNDGAVLKVYSLKQRPLHKALIVLVSSMEMAQSIADISFDNEHIAKHYWLYEKKPITLIFKLLHDRLNISKFALGGGNTAALRLPNDDFCLELIDTLGHPIVAPSANISNHGTAISAEMVRKDFGNTIPLIIDGGTCNASPSTIIDMTGSSPRVVR